MNVAVNITQVPTPIPEVVVADAVDAVVNDLKSTISNTLEAPLNLVSQTPKLVETATKAAENKTKDILKESQSVIDETTKLIDNITSVMEGKNEQTKLIADEATKAIMNEGQAIVDETTKLAVKTAENIANMVSEEEKRLTETISRLSIDMEQQAQKATGLFAKIHNFIKLIMSCTHGADKSVIIPVKVSATELDVKIANVV
jgi:hypothetical protein